MTTPRAHNTSARAIIFGRLLRARNDRKAIHDDVLFRGLSVSRIQRRHIIASFMDSLVGHGIFYLAQPTPHWYMLLRVHEVSEEWWHGKTVDGVATRTVGTELV